MSAFCASGVSGDFSCETGSPRCQVIEQGEFQQERLSQSGTATGSSTPERRSRKPERPPSGARTSSCDLNDPYSLVRPLNEMNVTRRAANRIQAGRSLRRRLCVCSPRQARTYQASEVPRVGPTSGLKDRAS